MNTSDYCGCVWMVCVCVCMCELGYCISVFVGVCVLNKYYITAV